MKEYASNHRATFDYEILEKLEAGLVLKGAEVKSIKNGGAQIKGSFVKILNGAPQLIGATISPYQPKNTPADYDPQATRTVLLSKKEIDYLNGLSKSKGVTLIPLKLVDHKGFIKLIIGVARGKKKYDKREAIKKKDVARAKQRGVE